MTRTEIVVCCSSKKNRSVSTLTKAVRLDSLAKGVPEALVKPDPECARGDLRRRSQLADRREMLCWRWAGCGI